MKHSNAAVLTAILIAAGFATTASANCGPGQTLLFGPASPAIKALVTSARPGQPSRISADAPSPTAPDPTMVGLWYVQFLQGGQVFDIGFDTWHADGTELLNDTPPPSSGNVCTGVWKSTGRFTYKLNHPSWIFDQANVNVIGIAFISEQVTLDPKGNSFTGTFSVDVYDFVGNRLDHETGELQGQRITPDGNQTEEGIPLPFPTLGAGKEN